MSGFSRSSLHRPQDTQSAKNEEVNELIIDKIEGTPFTEFFEAIVLSGEGSDNTLNAADADGNTGGGGTNYYFVRVRPLNLQEFTIPSPFNKMPECDARNIINQHPLGYFKSDGGKPEFGAVYRCRFVNKKLKTTIELVEKTRKLDVSTLPITDRGGVAANAFALESGQLLSELQDLDPQTDFSPIVRVSKTYTYGAYKYLAMQPKIGALLAFVSKAEGKYDSYNCGIADGGASCDALVKQRFGYGSSSGSKPLTQNTIAEIRVWVDKRKKGSDRNGLLAVGRYQFGQSPSAGYTQTLYPLLTELKGSGRGAFVHDVIDESTTVFSEEVQDAMATALILGTKRSVLHGYLLGKHNNLEAAWMDMAKEWASIPIPYDRGNGPDDPKKGQSYYEADPAGNSSSAKFTEADIEAALKAAREEILLNIGPNKPWQDAWTGAAFSELK